MTFLLDANVLLDFQNAALLPALVEAAQGVDMAIAEKVFDEVTLRRTGDSSDLVGKKRGGTAPSTGPASPSWRSSRGRPNPR